LSCPFARLGRPVRAPRDPWSSVAPRQVSELACVHLSIFEHADMDRRTEQSVRCVGAEAPFNVWSVDAAHLPGELDCRPLFRPLTPEVAGSSPFFARPFGSENGRQRERPQAAAFLSLRMTMNRSEGGG